MVDRVSESGGIDGSGQGDTGPFAPLTWPVERRVLGLVHSWQAGDRLGEFMPSLIEPDRRVQAAYTVPGDSRFTTSGTEYVRRMDAAALSWEHARAHRYDLAIAAHQGGLKHVRAPVLFLPHGAGYSKLVARRPGYGPPARRPVGGAVAGALVSHGRVLPAGIGVAHEWQRDVVARDIPDAAVICHVVGDPAYDRMLVSLPLRHAYRRALGVGEHQRLVVLSSTWGRAGLAGSRSELLTRLPKELPRDYAVAAVLHPAIWWHHGRRQVRAWSEEARRAGLKLLAPDAAWQALLVAADAVIGDNSSVGMYGAALGRPVLLAGGDITDIVPGSQVAELYRRARPFRDGESALGQIEQAVDCADPEQGAALAGLLTSAPGRSAQLLRRLAFRLMELPEPDVDPALRPLPSPTLVPDDSAGGVPAPRAA